MSNPGTASDTCCCHCAHGMADSKDRVLKSRGLQVAGWKVGGKVRGPVSLQMAGCSEENGKKTAGCRARQSPALVS